MKSLLQFLILILIVLMNSIALAWYPTFYNGDFNYVLATARMGVSRYVKMDSVKEVFSDDEMEILCFEGITVADGLNCDLKIVGEWERTYEFDTDCMEMTDIGCYRDYKGIWRFSSLNGLRYYYQEASLGEVAYASKYGQTFYKTSKRGCTYEEFVKMPDKILGQWDKVDATGCFVIENNSIKCFAGKNKLLRSDAIKRIVGFEKLRKINHYVLLVDDAMCYDFNYYDLGKEKVIVFDEGKVILHRTSDDPQGELLGGIFIGMSMKKVIDLYGEPTKTTSQNWYIKNHFFDNGLMVVTECAGYVARVQILSGSKKVLGKSGLGVENNFDKNKTWDGECLRKFEKVYGPYTRVWENEDKRSFANRFVVGDGVVVIKQCQYGRRDIILVAEGWIE